MIRVNSTWKLLVKVEEKERQDGTAKQHRQHRRGSLILRPRVKGS